LDLDFSIVWCADGADRADRPSGHGPGRLALLAAGLSRSLRHDLCAAGRRFVGVASGPLSGLAHGEQASRRKKYFLSSLLGTFEQLEYALPGLMLPVNVKSHACRRVKWSSSWSPRS